MLIMVIAGIVMYTVIVYSMGYGEGVSDKEGSNDVFNSNGY